MFIFGIYSIHFISGKFFFRILRIHSQINCILLTMKTAQDFHNKIDENQNFSHYPAQKEDLSERLNDSWDQQFSDHVNHKG